MTNSSTSTDASPKENEFDYESLLSFRESQYEQNEAKETSRKLAKAKLRNERIEEIIESGVLSLEGLLANLNYVACNIFINNLKSVISKEPSKDSITFSLSAYSSLMVDRPRENNYNSKYEDFMIEAFFKNFNQIKELSQEIGGLTEMPEIKAKLIPLAELMVDSEEDLLKSLESKEFPAWDQITKDDFDVEIDDDNNLSSSLLCTSFSVIFFRKFTILLVEQLRELGFRIENYSYDLEVLYPQAAGFEDSSQYSMTSTATFQILLPQIRSF